MNMHMSDEGIAHLKNEEGCRLRAYYDSVGVITIGYGHTGPDVYPGLMWTQAQAEAALARRLESEFGAAVNRGVRIQLKQHQFDALVSFAYNVGTAGFLNSTMLRKINAGDFVGATAEFDKWVIPSEITGRRMREKAMFAGNAVANDNAADNGAPSHTYALKTIDIQRILGVEADGIMGPKTYAAIKKFQKDHGLAVDGIVGPKTLEALSKTTRANFFANIGEKIMSLLAA